MQDIVVTGSIAYDYLMRFPGHFSEHLMKEHLEHVSVSFLVDGMTKHWGGNAANIAYTLALLGMEPHLFGTVGKDFGDYRDHLESHGVNCGAVRQHDDVFTASFFANTDLDNNQIASFYAGAMAKAHEHSLADVYEGTPDLVIISPNDPAAMLNLAEECRQRNIPFVADPSQQVPRLDGEQLRHCIEGAYLLVVNQYESEVIARKTGLSAEQLLDQVEALIITQGKDGSDIYTNGGITHVDVSPTETIEDPTGVGDAYRSGLLRGIAADLPLELSAQMGAVSAAYALERVGTQNHHFTVRQFLERFRATFDDSGQLDVLLSPEEAAPAK